MDGIKNSPGIERASLFERAVAEGDVGVDMGEDISLGSQDGGKREVNGSEKTSYDMYISPRALGTNYEEGNSKISRMMGSLSLPPELTSFALTYEKAYCSSLFMDCWTSERTLSRIDMPIRMRPQNQRPQKQATKFECLTCKVRRVKCDESKPSCLRCQKMGLKCGGYRYHTSKSRRENPRSNLSIPRRVMVPKFLLLCPQSLPEVALFRTDRECQYFKIFSQKIAEKGENNALVQLCQTEPILRTAIIALAALEKLSIASSVSENASERTESSLDSAIEYSGNLEHVRNPGFSGQTERSRKQLLSCVCLIYSNRTSISHQPDAPRILLEAISVAFEEWKGLLDPEGKLTTVSTASMGQGLVDGEVFGSLDSSGVDG